MGHFRSTNLFTGQAGMVAIFIIFIYYTMYQLVIASKEPNNYMTANCWIISVLQCSFGVTYIYNNMASYILQSTVELCFCFSQQRTLHCYEKKNSFPSQKVKDSSNNGFVSQNMVLVLLKIRRNFLKVKHRSPRIISDFTKQHLKTQS